LNWAAALAISVSGAAGGAAPEVELPAELAKQWRHPVLR